MLDATCYMWWGCGSSSHPSCWSTHGNTQHPTCFTFTSCLSIFRARTPIWRYGDISSHHTHVATREHLLRVQSTCRYHKDFILPFLCLVVMQYVPCNVWSCCAEVDGAVQWQWSAVCACSVWYEASQHFCRISANSFSALNPIVPTFSIVRESTINCCSDKLIITLLFNGKAKKKNSF